MKMPPNKDDLRRQIEDQIRRYLAHGGEVETVAKGVSGREAGDASLGGFRRVFQRTDAPREQRTPVPEIVAAIEARRGSRRVTPAPGKPGTPRKKPVLDDFGEPVRWVWVEDD